MKQVENSFIITGFVAKDAEIRTFTNNDVARFPDGHRPQGDQGQTPIQPRIRFHQRGSLAQERQRIIELLKKGTLLTIEGYLKPEEWTDRNGVKQNGIKFVAKKFYEAVEKPEEGRETPTQGSHQKTEGGGIDRFHLRKERLRPLFSCSTHLGPCSF